MDKKLAFRLALVCMLGIITFFILKESQVLLENPFNSSLMFNYPSVAASDNAGNIYTIDNSMKRILKFKSTGEAAYVIEGGKRGQGEFFFAYEITPDIDGNLYVLNNVLDESGMYVESEEILKYNPEGRFEKVVYRKDYKNSGDMPMRKGRNFGMSVKGGQIHCFYKEKNSVEEYTVRMDTGAVNTERKYVFENVESLLVDISGCSESGIVVCSTKQGELYTVGRDDKLQLLYSSSMESKESVLSIPWEVETDSGENVYFSDLEKRQIKRIDAQHNLHTVISGENLHSQGISDTSFYFSRFSLSGNGTIATVNGGGVLCVNRDGKVLYYGDSAAYPLKMMLFKLFIWLLLFAALAILLVLLRIIYVDGMKRHISGTLKQVAFITLAILFTTVFVSNMIYKSFHTRYENEVLNKLAQTTQFAAMHLDGDRIEAVKKPEQFMGKDYNAIRESLHLLFNNNKDPWNASLYGAIYKVVDNRLYAIMYYDDSVGTYHPVDTDYEGSEYNRAYIGSEITAKKESDSEGDWMYGVGPIYNSQGKVVGIVEVGTDLFGFEEENNKLIRDTLIDIATILVVLIFVITEITILESLLGRRKLLRGTQACLPALCEDVEIIRPLGFMLFTATSMSTSFIPVLMKNLYKPMWGLPESVILGLPISAEMLFVALSSIIAGYMIDKRGWKRVFIAGAVIWCLGALFSGLAWNAFSFIGARSIAGFGFGFSLIALQSFGISSPSEEERDRGIASLNSGALAGINCGVITGAMLAERIGFSNVFFIAILVAVVTVLFAFKFIQANVACPAPADKTSGGSRHPVRSFFGDVSVWSFFVFVFLPLSICGMFLAYFFPLYAESAGISPSNTGRAFLLNGLCIIYLGPMLSKYVLRFLGRRKSIVAAGMIAAAALLTFAGHQSLLTAYIAVALLGIAESFGITAQVNYFTSLNATNELGEGKAMGYYSLVENFGQVLGPIVFGELLAAGTGAGIGALGVLLVCTLTVFCLSTLQRKKAEKHSALAG